MLIGEGKPEIRESKRNCFRFYTSTREGLPLLILLTGFVMEAHFFLGDTKSESEYCISQMHFRLERFHGGSLTVSLLTF